MVREEALTDKALDGEIIDFRITEENEGFIYGDLVEKKKIYSVSLIKTSAVTVNFDYK